MELVECVECLKGKRRSLINVKKVEQEKVKGVG